MNGNDFLFKYSINYLQRNRHQLASIMRGSFYIFCFITLFVKNLQATVFPSTIGPVSMGCGSLTCVFLDPFSAYNHPGVFAFSKQNCVSFSVQSNYWVKGLNSAGLTSQYKLSKTTIIGSGLNYFGNAYYNESLLKTVIAKKFSSGIGAGIALDYFRLQFPKESFPVKNLLTCEIAIYARLTQNFDLGLLVSNPFPVELAEYNQEKLPFMATATILFHNTGPFVFAAEWCQIIYGMATLKMGMEYKYSEKLEVRAGIYNKPFNPCIGLTYKNQKISISVAISFHPYLNTSASPGLSINY